MKLAKVNIYISALAYSLAAIIPTNAEATVGMSLVVRRPFHVECDNDDFSTSCNGVVVETDDCLARCFCANGGAGLQCNSFGGCSAASMRSLCTSTNNADCYCVDDAPCTGCEKE
jgi:hypothetical protein